MSTTVYRIVLSDPPSGTDLMTYKELGIEVYRSDPDAERMRTGLSVFVSLSHARKRAKGMPWKGRCLIAEIELPDSADFVLEQTGSSSPNHYTLWCERAIIRDAIVRIHPIREELRHV
jgi:hypothetical protein